MGLRSKAIDSLQTERYASDVISTVALMISAPLNSKDYFAALA